MGYNIQKYIVFYIDTTGLDIYHDYMNLVTYNYYGFSKYFIEQVDFLPNKIIDTLLLSKEKHKGMKSYDMDYILKKYDINTVKGDSIKNIVSKIQQLFLILTSKSN